jgi:predicted PurR-regulated permease PerM
MNRQTGAEPITVYDWAGWVIAAGALLLVLPLHLLAALFSGLLVYELAHFLVGLIHRRLMSRATARLLAVLLIAVIIISLVALGVGSLVAFFRGGTESVPALLQKMAEVLESSKAMLPDWVQSYLPADANELRATIVSWLREHAGLLQLFGAQAGRVAAHLLFGMIIGGLLSLVEPDSSYRRPLARSLIERASRLRGSFRRIVLAQGRISAVNTFFTWIYLGVAMPLFGVELPFVKTMVAVTFVAGLLPIIGNLISNTVIVIVSLSVSPYVAVVSLAYLVAIHKLEYFLNAHIIGTQIRAAAWELLLAMLVGEAAFGIAGVVAAPLYYAYVKDELAAKRLV